MEEAGIPAGPSDNYKSDCEIPTSLSAVSGAPARTVRVRMRFARALLIQRLEGSRPQGSLCILNGAEGGRCVDELVVICADCPLYVGTKLGAVA